MTKDCPFLTYVCNYVKQEQPSSQPVVLTNPYPAPQQMVSQASAPPSRGASSSSVTILMADAIACLSSRAKNYDQLEGSSATKATPLTSQPDSSLTLERTIFELPSRPSKVTFHWTTHNFNTQATQHYSIVEDLT